MIRRLLFPAITMACCLGFQAQAGDAQYLVEVKIISIPKESRSKVVLSGDTLAADNTQRTVSVSGDLRVKMGDLLITEKNGNILINKKRLKDSAAEVMSAPRLMILSGKKASMRAGSEKAIEYFAPVPEKDGFYSLKRMNVNLGLKLDITVKEVGKGDGVRVDLTSKLTTLKGRQKLEGVELSVGAPLISENSTSTTAVLKLGSWLMTTGYTANDVTKGKKATVLTLLKVSKASAN